MGIIFNDNTWKSRIPGKTVTKPKHTNYVDIFFFYKCSNFYRLLVETKTVNDPNYVLDEHGKAHYLFDKKSADGQIKKTFRTHSKHATTGESSVSRSSPRPSATPRSRKKKEVVTPSSNSTSNAAAATNTIAIAEPSASAKGRGRSSNGNGKAITPKSAGSRRRRRANHNSDSENTDSELYDDDFSGNYSTRSSRDLDEENGMRKSKRARRPTAAAIESGLATHSSWHTSADDEDDPTCPLPGFIDPITLEQVAKPAISKYGHVMGYDSWVRCLNNWEGKKNTCPLTKKALSKRDLGKGAYMNIFVTGNS